MPQHNLNVNLGSRSYDICIGDKLLQPQMLKPLLQGHLGKQVAIITNPIIAEHYLTQVQVSLSDHVLISIFISDGEQHKNQQSLNHIFQQLAENQFNRNCTLIALGGGVIGDLTGFAAATWMRGVKFVQIPTTLLAQVDSSVGGKTGINHNQGKNLIGAFHQPQLVVIDTATLQTLPQKQLLSGLAEVIKYGLIWDKTFWQQTQLAMSNILKLERQALQTIIQRSCAIKAEIVATDETEQSIRALLNFGHTFGHAIEALTQYNTWLHGEAISIGMCLASELSRRMGHISQAEVSAICQSFSAIGLPTELPDELSQASMLKAMQGDKKK